VHMRSRRGNDANPRQGDKVHKRTAASRLCALTPPIEVSMLSPPFNTTGAPKFTCRDRQFSAWLVLTILLTHPLVHFRARGTRACAVHVRRHCSWNAFRSITSRSGPASASGSGTRNSCRDVAAARSVPAYPIECPDAAECAADGIAERDNADDRPRALEGAEWNELAVLEVGALCASRYGRFQGYETTATLRASSSAVPATLSHGGTQSTGTGSCWCTRGSIDVSLMSSSSCFA